MSNIAIKDGLLAVLKRKKSEEILKKRLKA